MDSIYVFLLLWESKLISQTLCEILVKFLEDNCKISISDYTINEYSLALFINKNANFRLNLFKKFIYKKNKIDFLKTSIAKKIFKEISLITGLTEKKITKNKIL